MSCLGILLQDTFKNCFERFSQGFPKISLEWHKRNTEFPQGVFLEVLWEGFQEHFLRVIPRNLLRASFKDFVEKFYRDFVSLSIIPTISNGFLAFNSFL